MGAPDATKSNAAAAPSSEDPSSSGTSSQSTSSNQSGAGLTPRSTKVPKITVLKLELTTSLKDEAVSKFIDILQTNPLIIEKDLATELKKHFDQKFGQTWHCIVGKRFGCSIAYDTQMLLYFKADQHYVLLFKSIE